jgi:hypothetical protein
MLQQLQDLMADELPVGADALDVTEQLYDVFGDDEMFDELSALALRDPEADARPVITKYMQKLGIELPEPAVQQTQPPAQPPAEQQPTQEMLEFPKVTEEDDFEITDPKEVGAKMNPAYISPNAAKNQSSSDKSAPAPAKIGVSTQSLPDYKFEEIERIKSIVSYLNR